MVIFFQIIALGSYLVAKAFFTVYEMGVDTIFLCVCKCFLWLIFVVDTMPVLPLVNGQNL